MLGVHSWSTKWHTCWKPTHNSRFTALMDRFMPKAGAPTGKCSTDCPSARDLDLLIFPLVWYRGQKRLFCSVQRTGVMYPRYMRIAG